MPTTPEMKTWLALVNGYMAAHPGIGFNDADLVCQQEHPTAYKAMTDAGSPKRQAAIENAASRINALQNTAFTEKRDAQKARHAEIEEVMAGWPKRSYVEASVEVDQRCRPALGNSAGAGAKKMPPLYGRLFQPAQIASLGLTALDRPDEIKYALEDQSGNLPPMGKPDLAKTVESLTQFWMLQNGISRQAATDLVKSRHPGLFVPQVVAGT